MADDDFLLADQHLLDEEPDDALALRNVQGFGRRAQARQEAVQGLRDPEIGLPVLGLIDNGLQFAMQSLLLTAQLGHSGAELVDCDQLLLIGVD